ncbi:MAG: hypothetical protein ACK4UN_20255, partial [Limisphaerales bacterium]
LLSVTQTNTNVVLNWAAVGGRSYVIQSAIQLSDSSQAGFVDVSPIIVMPGTNEGPASFTHIGGASANGRFYRIQTLP